MGAGYHGGFGHTKGTEKHINKSLHKGRQEKHIVGSKNYIPGRSIFSGDINYAQKLIRQYSGTGIKLGGNKERIDFCKPIGYYVDQTTRKEYKTTIGIIHYSKDGAHIVLCKPKEK